MRTNASWVAATALAALLVAFARAPAAAWAQAGGADSAMTEEARRLYDEGRAAKLKGDHATCVAKLRAGWALKKHRQLAGLLGECELRAGENREATEHLAYFLDHAGDLPGETVAQMQALFEEARASVSIVTVTTDVEGADRKVDGRALAPEEKRVFLTPGEHVFAASKPGVGAQEKRLFVSGGQVRDLVLELTPAPAAGGEAAPLAPRAPSAPPPEHETDRSSVVPGLVIGGVGLAAVGVGIGLLVAAAGKGSDAEAIAAELRGSGAYCQPVTAGYEQDCGAFEDAASDQDTLNLVGAISLIGGGVLVVAGSGWTLWAATHPRATRGGDSSRLPHLTVSPALGIADGGLRLHGAF